MPAPSDRMQKLQQLLERDPTDNFLIYAIGLEHKKAGEYPQALAMLRRAIQNDPNYCVAWLQSGQVHELAGDIDAARNAYRDGIVAARRAGDGHAAEEMQAALDMLG